jgi:ABC-2 type transport system permease protein
MIQFAASVSKELLLLVRDRIGLLMLFAMPSLLVLVITLVQNNAVQTVDQSSIEILFLDEDGQAIGQKLEAELSRADGVSMTRLLDGRHPDRQTALEAVKKGDYQLCLIVPPGMSAAVKQKAYLSARQSLSLPSDDRQDGAIEVPGLVVYFDPVVMGSFRSAVKHLIQLLLVGIEVEARMAALSEAMPEAVKQSVTQSLGPTAAKFAPEMKMDVDLSWDPQPMIPIDDAVETGAAYVKTPNAVQHNVPAWALFGVFFIALPMAGSFVKERLYGVQYRMLSMPVSYVTVAAGKVFAYMLVCLIQFALIFTIGNWILPALGTPSFEMGAAPATALLVALAAILAATGYGILLGTLVTSYQQASTFGPISIVIAAAMGGIMVPVWAMPDVMQKLSMMSPLSWAQNAFIEIFVRNGSFAAVRTDLTCLVGFAAVCILVAWRVHQRRFGTGAR